MPSETGSITTAPFSENTPIACFAISITAGSTGEKSQASLSTPTRAPFNPSGLMKLTYDSIGILPRRGRRLKSEP